MNNEPREPFALEPLPDDRPRRGAGALSAIGQGVVTGLLLIALGALLAVLAALGVYAYYARDLPMPDEMVQRSALFKSTKIMDRHGRISRGRSLWRTAHPRHRSCPGRYEATVATEDATFS